MNRKTLAQSIPYHRSFAALLCATAATSLPLGLASAQTTAGVTVQAASARAAVQPEAFGLNVAIWDGPLTGPVTAPLFSSNRSLVALAIATLQQTVRRRSQGPTPRAVPTLGRTPPASLLP